MIIGWAGLAGALVCAYLAPNKMDRPSWVLGALIFLQISQLIAIPGAVIWGNGNWVLTAGVVLWALPMPLVYLVADRQLFGFLCSFAMIHALFIIIQEFTSHYWIDGTGWVGVPNGFSHNANLAAGLLVLSIPFAVTGYRRWFLIPFLAALIFTGSRWAFIVSSIMVMAMGYKNVISLRWILVALGSLLTGIAVMGIFTPVKAAVSGLANIENSPIMLSQLEVRLAIPDWPNILPYGIAETDGLHNVPLRMAAEWGIISAVVWVGLTVWGLSRMRFSPAWWLMVAIVLLSLLDHYTWRPHLMGFWFVALGILAVRPLKIDTVNKRVIKDDIF
tara:strand:- start:10102 stop:11097 length:996 start_codon:yes stop_codon:yes gene_type:complete